MKLIKGLAKWGLSLGLPALLVLSFGCGTDRAPVALDEAGLASAEGPVLLAFSPEAAQRAAKRVTAAVTASAVEEGSAEVPSLRKVARVIGPSGGKLTMEDCSGGKGSEIIADFIVPGNALDQEREISMAVQGEVLSDLVVKFEPGGLVFNPSATLELVLGSKRVDIDTKTLKIWHVYNDGTVEEAVVEGSKLSGQRKFTLIVEIPGFSRYGMAHYGD